MGEVVIQGIEFVGDSGSHVPGLCPNCGPTKFSVPFLGMDSLTLVDTKHTCLKCGRQVSVESAYYDFEKKVFEKLLGSNLTRQQARRFARKVAKSRDIENLSLHAELINPKLGEATQLAKEEKDPFKAINRIAAVALFCFSALGGIDKADDIWDKYQSGQFFQKEDSSQAKAVEQKADKDTGDVSGGSENADRRIELPKTLEI